MGFACLTSVFILAPLLECWKLPERGDRILCLIFLISLTFRNTYLRFLLFRNLALVIEKNETPDSPINAKQSGAFWEQR